MLKKRYHIPQVPHDAEIDSHGKGLKIYLNPKRMHKVELHYSGENLGQEGVRKEFEGKFNLSASDMDYLLDHQEHIPKEWEKVVGGIYFWDTIFTYTGNREANWYPDYSCVMGMTFKNGQWERVLGHLHNYGWDRKVAGAVLKIAA